MQPLKFKKSVLAIVLVAVSLSYFLLPTSAKAEVLSLESLSYTVKLNSDDTFLLNTVATNIQPHFNFSKAIQFDHIFTFDSKLSKFQLELALKGSFDYIEPLVNFQTKDTITPNDPGFTSDPYIIDKSWGLSKTSFISAWEKTKGSSNVVAAIIDTGVDETHEDLKSGSFAYGYNFVNNTSILQGTNTDDNGHGTLVAGVIAATPNNRVGIAGTNWQITLMPLKALDGTGSGSSVDIAEAIVWAADHGANIINLSVGGLGFAHDTTLSNAVSHAYNKNVVIVAAAGNDAAVTGGNLDESPVFPVCNDNAENMVIGVTATDQNDLKPGFANFGRACIDVTAPGKRILSTINHDPLSRAYAPNAYAYASGTSLAVPFVVGQAALLKSLYPQATNKQIRDRIVSTTDKIDDFNLFQCGGSPCKGFIGTGRINVAQSLLKQILPPVEEGDLITIENNPTIYYINGGKRHPISGFVLAQRFSGKTQKIVSEIDVVRFPEGNFVEPLDGTLVKQYADPTVYYVSKGLKLPITLQIFKLRGFNFNDVKEFNQPEISSWLTGSFLTPPEGTLVRTPKKPTVYWVVGDALHGVNRGFYDDRGLSIFPIILVPENDLKSFSQGEVYVR